MLIPPDEADHFLRVYKALLQQIAGAELDGTKDYLTARRVLYQPKHLRKPPTGDPDLLAALKAAVYGDFIVGRHLARSTEMVGPAEQVYRVQGLTIELRKIVPPWVYVKTAVMLFRGYWICDGLLEGGNVLIGSNMIRELTEIIRDSPRPTTATRKAGARKVGGEGQKTASPKENKVREERIAMEIVVDAYNDSERAMGWYCYLEEKLAFPFRARCVGERPISPLAEGDKVEVTAMAPSEECAHEMFVEVKWQQGSLAIPLSQLEVSSGGRGTKEAVADWNYWVARGYGF